VPLPRADATLRATHLVAAKTFQIATGSSDIHDADGERSMIAAARDTDKLAPTVAYDVPSEVVRGERTRFV